VASFASALALASPVDFFADDEELRAAIELHDLPPPDDALRGAGSTTSQFVTGGAQGELGLANRLAASPEFGRMSAPPEFGTPLGRGTRMSAPPEFGTPLQNRQAR
jgi:hypothetical protein